MFDWLPPLVKLPLAVAEAKAELATKETPHLPLVEVCREEQLTVVCTLHRGNGPYVAPEPQKTTTVLSLAGLLKPWSGTVTFNPGQTTRNVTVNVVGDTIVDSYSYCSLLGAAPKSPTFSVKHDNRPLPSIEKTDMLTAVSLAYTLF